MALLVCEPGQWVEFAGIDTDAASGILFRMNPGSTLCPMVLPSQDEELEKKIEEGVRLLRNSVVLHESPVPAQVFYKLYMQKVRESPCLWTFLLASRHQLCS